MLAIRRQLHKAINENDVTQIKVILHYHRLKVDFEHRNSEGKTLLHECCEKGCLDIVRLLVEQGARIESTDLNGNTSLHYSCLYGHINITRYLILNCANLYSRNNAGLLPVDVCSHSDLKILVEMAMNIDTLGGKNMTIGRIRSKKTNINTIVNVNNSLTTNCFNQEIIKKIKIEDCKNEHKGIKIEASNQCHEQTNIVKKKSSLKLKEPKCLPKHKQKLSLKTNDIKKSSSEADIRCINAEVHQMNCIKKVKNTDHINLVGLSIQ
nr:ankyrin repeat domain-containing protein 27 [Hydra vulgaris]